MKEKVILYQIFDIGFIRVKKFGHKYQLCDTTQGDCCLVYGNKKYILDCAEKLLNDLLFDVTLEG